MVYRANHAPLLLLDTVLPKYRTDEYFWHLLLSRQRLPLNRNRCNQRGSIPVLLATKVSIQFSCPIDPNAQISISENHSLDRSVDPIINRKSTFRRTRAMPDVNDFRTDHFFFNLHLFLEIITVF